MSNWYLKLQEYIEKMAAFGQKMKNSPTKPVYEESMKTGFYIGLTAYS